MESVYKRRTKEYSICLALLFFLIVPCTVKAAPDVMSPAYSRLQKEGQLCRELDDKIKNKQDTRKFVKTSIQLGYNACGVVICAIKSGGDLKQILEGAVEAGATKDTLSRCALDAGVDAKDVAFILNNMDLILCYLPEEPHIIIPVPSPPDRFVSPSHF